jgi:hypothetical protein
VKTCNGRKVYDGSIGGKERKNHKWWWRWKVKRRGQADLSHHHLNKLVVIHLPVLLYTEGRKRKEAKEGSEGRKEGSEGRKRRKEAKEGRKEGEEEGRKEKEGRRRKGKEGRKER